RTWHGFLCGCYCICDYWFMRERVNCIALLYINPGCGVVFRHSSACRTSHSVCCEQGALNFIVDPYAKPEERKVGSKRPKITHLPKSAETRTRRERQAEKQAVAAERRASKKAARRHLKQKLQVEVEEN